MSGKEGTLGRVCSKGRRVMPLRARLGECAIAFLLTAVLTGAEFLQGRTFFALALVAVWGPGLEGICALLGASLGYLCFLGFVGGFYRCPMLSFAGDVRDYFLGWKYHAIASFLR